MAVYPTYVSLATADGYLTASPRYPAWVAETDDDVRSGWLVEATRMLSRHLADPYDDPEEEDMPQAIQDACCELAALLQVDSSVVNAPNAGKNIKSVSAGKGVGVTFFGPTTRTAGRFPVVVQELIREYLASTAAVSALAVAMSGDDCEASSFDACDEYDVDGGL